MAAASANIASMNDGGSSSWSMECAPTGFCAAATPAPGATAVMAVAATTASATASGLRPSMPTQDMIRGGRCAVNRLAGQSSASVRGSASPPKYRSSTA